ncbi:hypothetical protein NPIL_79401, partial [Nephila pilipes]
VNEPDTLEVYEAKERITETTKGSSMPARRPDEGIHRTFDLFFLKEAGLKEV